MVITSIQLTEILCIYHFLAMKLPHHEVSSKSFHVLFILFFLFIIIVFVTFFVVTVFEHLELVNPGRRAVTRRLDVRVFRVWK